MMRVSRLNDSLRSFVLWTEFPNKLEPCNVTCVNSFGDCRKSVFKERRVFCRRSRFVVIEFELVCADSPPSCWHSYLSCSITFSLFFWMFVFPFPRNLIILVCFNNLASLSSSCEVFTSVIDRISPTGYRILRTVCSCCDKLLFVDFFSDICHCWEAVSYTPETQHQTNTSSTSSQVPYVL